MLLSKIFCRKEGFLFSGIFQLGVSKEDAISGFRVPLKIHFYEIVNNTSQ